MPLRGKHAVCDAWQVTPPAEQWETVGPSFRGNIGVRVGNGVAVADGDDEQTNPVLQAYFEGLGLHPPTVSTASRVGRHFYLRVTEAPPDFNWAHLSPSVGKGELRVRNALLVAPCSIVDSVPYGFVKGSPEAIPELRPVRFPDLVGLLSPAALSAPSTLLSSPPVPLVRRDLPSAAHALLVSLVTAQKGQRTGRYPSRSEAEAAAVAMLILAGWDFAEIAALFEQRQPGHYREAGRHRARYLQRTYRKALTMLAATPERVRIAEAHKQAPLLPWSGRGWILDLRTYQAILGLQWQFSALEVGASLRDLALHTGASLSGVSKALHRLAVQGLIIPCGQDEDTETAIWQAWLPQDLDEGREDVAKVGISHTPSLVGSPEEGSMDPTGIIPGTKPWYYGTSRVFMALGTTPCNAVELAAAIGLHRSTVSRILGQLRSSGLALPTTTNARGEPTGWVRGEATVEDFMKSFGSQQEDCQRREQFRRERERFQIIRAERTLAREVVVLGSG
jgi:hypothetical protein